MACIPQSEKNNSWLTWCRSMGQISRVWVLLPQAFLLRAHHAVLEDCPSAASVQLGAEILGRGQSLYSRIQPFLWGALLSLPGIPGGWQTGARLQIIVDHRTHGSPSFRHLCPAHPTCFFWLSFFLVFALPFLLGYTLHYGFSILNV